MAEALRILHLSDFHFSEARAWDQDPVLGRLAEDVLRFRQDGLKPDLVALTGDIADRGSATEYALAATWLRERLLPAAALTPADVLLVPGNHDADRSLVKPVARAIQADLLKGDDKAQDRIAAILSDSDERAPLLKRHAAWIEFARGFGAAGADLPWWSQTRGVGSRSLHIAGFCSSWMSCSDEDKGRLLLGRWQVNALLQEAQGADLSIALMHHPWDYLADFDVAAAREEIRRRCALVLRGHWHAHEGETRERPDGAVVELAAGSCYAGSEYRNAYHLIELDPKRRIARVHLRVWDGHDWIPDRNAYAGTAPDGVAEFRLPEGKAPPKPPRRKAGPKTKEARARTIIDTGGGAAVTGHVTVAGNFIGRDQININAKEVHLGAAPEPPEALLAAYYRSLAAECRALPLGVIDTQFVTKGGEDAVPLPDIYVDLDVITTPPPKRGDERSWGALAARGEGGERKPLLEAVAAPEAARSVLLGDAGSGKTTFVNYLSYLLIAEPQSVPEALRDRLVVRLVLREVAARHIPAEATKGKAQMLWEALRSDIADRLGEPAADALFPYLQQRLLEERSLILLDGLDEVPEANRRRNTLLGAIRDLDGSLPKAQARLLLTGRPYAYADPAWHLKGFPILALAPFSSEQSARFIERFYQAVRKSTGWTEATARDRGGRLQAALQDKAYLAELGARPLLLTLMATLHASWGQLPEDRADLLEETVKLLLGRWQRAREVKGGDGQPVLEPGIAQCLNVGEERIRSALEQIALQVHRRQREGAAEDSAPADVPEGDVLVAFKPLLGSIDPEMLFGYLRDRAGLLVTRREGVFAFPHRSFQEYLAACRLSKQPDFCSIVRSDPKWWREVWLLGAAKVMRGTPLAVVGLMNELLPEAPSDVAEKTESDWQAASLVGQAILETRLAKDVGGQQAYETLVRRCRNWLVQLVEGGELTVRERAEAGDVLARLGDPLFDAKSGFLPARYNGQPEPFLGFVEVPAGPFVMGSRKGRDGCLRLGAGQPAFARDPLRLLDRPLPGDRGAVRSLHRRWGL